MEYREGPLLERARELDLLRALVERSVAGEGQSVVVEGSPGIGKSRLLAAARHVAEEQGCTVWRARATPLEQGHPFGVARQLLGSTSAVDGAQDGKATGREGSAAEHFFEILDALFREVAGRAHQQPLALLVDDIHWADPESLRFLTYLTARVETLPVVVVMATRPVTDGPRSDWIALLAAVTDVVSPVELSPAAVTELVGVTLGPPDDAFAAACYQVSGGNPHLVSELMLATEASGLAPSADNVDRVAAVTPAGVHRSVLVRLAHECPEDAVRLAGAVAVLGDGCSLREAAALSGTDDESAGEQADALVRAHLLTKDRPLEFLHPLIRNAVYEDLSLGRRSAMHARAARLLEERGEATDRIAAHLVHIAPRGDPWVTDTLWRAGSEAAARGAPGGAVTYFRRALEEQPEGPRDGEHLLVELAHAEAAVGAPESVEHLSRALAGMTDGRERARAGQTLSRVLFVRGSFRHAGEVALRALDELDDGDELDESVLADVMAAATMCPWFQGTIWDRVEGLLRQADAGVLPRLPQLRAHLAVVMAMMGYPHASVLAMAQAAMSEAADGPESWEETSVGATASFVTPGLIIIDELGLAEELLRGALERAMAQGSIVAAGHAHQALASICYLSGQLEPAIVHAQASLELCDAGWDLFVGFAAPTLAWCQLYRGDLDAARSAVRLGQAIDRDRPDYALVLLAEGRLAMAEGRPGDARSSFEAAGERALVAFGVEVPGFVGWRPQAALAAEADDDHAAAVELARAGVELVRPQGPSRALGMALSAAGQVVGGPDGLALAAEAVEVLTDSPARLDFGAALLALGSLTCRTGRAVDARAPLRQALEVTRSCGAFVLVEQALEELEMAGARPRKIVRLGREALTPAERRVASLAAEGLSNKEIANRLVVGVRTVETHLARTYTKLGISARRELTAALVPSGDGT